MFKRVQSGVDAGQPARHISMEGLGVAGQPRAGGCESGGRSGWSVRTGKLGFTVLSLPESPTTRFSEQVGQDCYKDENVH